MTHRAGRFFPDIRKLVVLLLAGWLIFNLVQTVQYVTADYSQIPVADYWRVAQLWPQYSAFHFSNLWVQHNEHRILFPEIIFILDMFLLHGRMYLPIALSGLCYVGVWFVLVWGAYSQKVIATPWREIALLVAGILTAWKGCSTVIATPFQLAFTMMQFAVALALACLAKTVETGRAKYLAATITAAVIATYSVGNGMVVWAVLIVCAVFLKLGRKQILILTVAAAGFVGLYFFHYYPLPNPMSTNIKHPALGFQFICSYMSMPFGSFGVPVSGVIIGAANLLMMGVCSAFAWRRKMLRLRLGLVVFGAYLFTLLSALLTTAGRMDLNDLVFNQAKAWRYATMPTMGWAFLTIAVVWVVSEMRSATWSWVSASLLVAFFGYGFVKAGRWVEGTRLDTQNAQITATMLRNRIFDSEQVRTIFPFVDDARRYAKVLRDDRKSIWAHGEDKWIGQDIRQLAPFSAPIPGRITRVYPVPGGLELYGWADTASLVDDHDVLFVDAGNKIVGFGRRPAAGMPEDSTTWDVPNSLAFVGFVALEKPVGKLSVYIRILQGRLTKPLDTTIEIPQFTAISDDSDKASIAGISWKQDANWALKGYPAGPWNGPIPNGPIYGSAGGSASRTGMMYSSPFATPADRCVVLPVLHGTASYGLSVEVRDADSNQEIANTPMLDGRSVWERWRIPIPEATRNVTIAAEDQGIGPNQWVAIATPEHCP